jgi:hypothetical protein
MAPATAAAAPPAAIPAPGMPAAPATAEGSGAPKALSPLDAALAKQQYALVSLQGFLATCVQSL